MSKPKLNAGAWTYLYAELSDYIQESCSIDPIWVVDQDGNERRTDDKEDEFVDIVNDVEQIMSKVLEKGGF